MAGLWHLSDTELLQQLAAGDLEEFQRAARVRSYGAGDVVFAPTESPRSVYILTEGAVRIFRRSEKGGEATFGYVQPGEVFGELPAVTALARESYAEATTASVVWQVPIELFRRLLGSRPGVAEQVSRQLGQRMKRIERRVEGLMFDDARLRLAVILQELSEHFGREHGDAIEIDGNFTQSELATLVGCTRQTLNQSLGELESRGLVEMKRRRLRLSKPDALREFIRTERAAGGA